MILKEKTFGPVDGFRSKRGFPFAASIILTDEYELKFDFMSHEVINNNTEKLYELHPAETRLAVYCMTPVRAAIN